MRVAYTADLHIDASPRNREALGYIIRTIESYSPDVIVVAGDVGNTLDDLDESLSSFSRFEVPKLFVAGNHDVWIEERGGRTLHSREKYETCIPAGCSRHGFTDLSQGPVVIDGVGFVGSLGWYDYTFADPRLRLSEEDCWRGLLGEEKWWDREMAFWPPASPTTSQERLRDPAVCAELCRVLESHVATAAKRVDRIVAVIHTLPFVETLPRSEPPYYLDAFTGARRLGEILQRCPQMSCCIGGHKHLNGDWQVGSIAVHRRTLGRVESSTAPQEAAKSAVDFVEL